MINLNTLMIAIRTRLKADVTLATIIGDVYRGAVPSTATWAKPNLEIGVQADMQNQQTSYGTRTQDVIIRIMAHDKGEKPGIGSYGRCYAALTQAEAVLFATPLTASGMTIVDFRRDSGIPEAMPFDTQGYRRMQVGTLLRLRIDEA